jgi:CheY-like chemotaxis protein
MTISRGSKLSPEGLRRLEPRILIVDDDRQVGKYFRQFLAREGIATDLAVTGHDARAYLLNIYRGIFLDLHLPDVDGIELLRDLRSAGNPSPVVVVTGYASVTHAVDAMKLGALDFILKPVRATDLSRVVIQMQATSKQFESVNQIVERLAKVVLWGSRANIDFRNGPALSRIAGVSYGTMRRLCWSAEINCLEFVRFTRVFRAVRLFLQAHSRVRDFLDVVDKRALNDLLSKANLAGPNCSLQSYCVNQRFLPPESPVALRSSFLAMQEDTFPNSFR